MSNLSSTSLGFNKYGEPCEFHGPVCSVCHQRIGLDVDYHITQKQENLCEHCYVKLVPNV